MKKKKLSKIDYFLLIRIITYLSLTLSFIIIPTKIFESGKTICFLKTFTGLNCPTCGVTRAFSSFLHLNFIKAFNYNQIFTVAIFPICLFLFTEEIITFFQRILMKKEKLSIIESFYKGII